MHPCKKSCKVKVVVMKLYTSGLLLLSVLTIAIVVVDVLSTSVTAKV